MPDAGLEHPFPGEDRADRLWAGGGRQIPVMGRQAAQTVPHAAADRPRRVPGGLQPVDRGADGGGQGDQCFFPLGESR